MITAKFDVFVGPSGGVSLEAGDGKSLIAQAGNMIEEDVAENLGLVALFDKKSAEKMKAARKSSDPLAALAADKVKAKADNHTPKAETKTEVK